MPSETTAQRKLVTIVFTDTVGSTQLKQELGEREAVVLIKRHHALIREVLRGFAEGEEIETAGDSFFLVFAKPSDAVQFALLVQSRLRALAKDGHAVRDRVGVHVGEVLLDGLGDEAQPRHPSGLHVDTCARVMSLAQGDQILLTRFAFDSARSVLRGEEIEGLGALCWMNHGSYLLKGLEEPIEICEVGESGVACLKAPADMEKAHRQVSPGEEPVLGWRPAVGQTVPGTKWTLEKKLGEGGFGEVWLGRHETLKEKRVFKFCFRADRVRALKREVTLFRVMKEKIGQHANIVGIQEVFFDQPPFYIVMDYAEGQDLRAWCEAQGGVEKVPLTTRLEIVAQVADALQAAHEAGVIHRDVKPSNILISNLKSEIPNPKLNIKLTDFGIGQVVSQEALAGMTRMGFTQTMMGPGSSSHTGTQLYMAPELMAGQPASVGSDIYSLGVVLYQLLSEDFSRPLTIDWAKRISDPLLREDLEKCFAGDPKERFANTGQLAGNLRSLVQRGVDLGARQKAASRRRIVRTTAVTLALVAAVFFLITYAFKQGRGTGAPGVATRNDIESLAVLPFQYVSGDPNKSDIANTMTEDIIAKLGQLSGVKKVIGYATMMTYQRTKKPLPKIAEELSVDAIVEGSVALTSNQLNIKVRLTEGAQGKVWLNTNFLRSVSNVLQLQSDVALAIAQAIHLNQTAEVRTHLTKIRTVNPDAWDSYWHGRSLLNTGNNADNLAAISNFQSAVHFDPNFAEGWAALAIACAQRSYALAPQEHLQWESDSYEAIQRARELDEDLAEAYVALGWLLFTPSKNFAAEAAVFELRHAIRLNPNSSEAHRWLGAVFSHTGFPDRAEAEHRRRAELEPEVPGRLTNIAVDLVLKGEHQQALNLFRKDPGGGVFAALHGAHYAWALFACGQTNAAYDKLKELLEKYPDDKAGGLAGMNAVLLSAASDVAGATNQIHNAMKKQETGYGEFHHTAYFIACAYALLDKQSEAVDWLEKTADMGFPCYPLFVRDPNLDHLRVNRDFVVFLKKQESEWQRRSNLWFKADAPGK